MARTDSSWSPGAGSTPARTELRLALLALLAVTLTGTLGFMWIEGWDGWRSLYFTLITITTVGYGDEGISDAGRRFALVLLVGGFGVCTYTFALLVQYAITNPLDWRRRMQRRIQELSNHTIVCGFGRMGRAVCERLARAGAPFVVVDHDAGAVEDARALGYLVVPGPAVEDDVLRDAGIERARHLVSAVDAASENIVITLTARELGPQLEIVARAEQDTEVRKLRRAGATRTISPFQSGGYEVADGILGATAHDAQPGPRPAELSAASASTPRARAEDAA